ncbi:AAA family ATPase [Cyclobacterium qasimii]|uniref:ATPase AAA-type core domain-containing protein n=2 Tax=Cyclobacterium qasimii TaxID=1350429 RepID=S7V6C0_9BACT|nr:AAA family ATPase [Cyclobacterium qasimii]EPR65486.1 hypothetical protein ADICYQ_5407 [Cyclobacterium qasimii M12-11B]GEO19649.1 hypothetical protein CQA01_01830 [Cyclobacterium qasimii]
MRISEIILNNYRAFYNEKGKENTKHKIDFGGKQNLLLYGENGSGKSSVFKGLKDLFQSSVDPDSQVVQNVFSKQIDSDHQPFVRTTFKGEGDPEIFTFSNDPHIPYPDHDLLKSVARIRSFMSYRDLMRIHFINDPKVNLFDFLFGKEGLLSEMPNPSASQAETNIRMSELWQNVQTAPDDTNQTDFRNGANQILSDLSTSLNALLKYFDQSLTVSFEPLSKEKVEANTPFLQLNVSYFGINLNEEPENYHYFLNEARLSALAICIFLAAHLSVPSTDYELLFLDDIFTGLDTSNRMPLLDIFTATEIEGTEGDTFMNHQIILTTYDRQWYELARNHLGNSNWFYQEVYIDHHSDGFDQPALIPGEDNFERAGYYFKMKQYPACANYQRRICENLIKLFLPNHKKYDALPNGDIKPVDKLASLIDRFESYLTEHDLDFTPFNKLRNCLRVVMNPLSHDDLESPAYRRELELVFEIIGELKQLKRTTILKAGKKIHLKKAHGTTGIVREYVCELKSNIVKLEHGTVSKLSRIDILPISQQDTGRAKRVINFEGTIEDIYNKLCHSLEIDEAVNLLEDFELTDGTNLNNFLNG